MIFLMGFLVYYTTVSIIWKPPKPCSEFSGPTLCGAVIGSLPDSHNGKVNENKNSTKTTTFRLEWEGEGLGNAH